MQDSSVWRSLTAPRPPIGKMDTTRSRAKRLPAVLLYLNVNGVSPGGHLNWLFFGIGHDGEFRRRWRVER